MTEIPEIRMHGVRRIHIKRTPVRDAGVCGDHDIVYLEIYVNDGLVNDPDHKVVLATRLVLFGPPDEPVLTGNIELK